MVIEITLNAGGTRVKKVRQKSGGGAFKNVPEKVHPGDVPTQAPKTRVIPMTLMVQPGGPKGDPCLIVGRQLFCW